MKILILGSGSPGAIENYYLKYLKEFLGDTNIKLLDIQSIFNEFYYKNIINKIKFRLKISFIYESINMNIMKTVEDFNPTIIWVFKGLEVYPKTLTELKNRGIVLLNYNPDNPFIFSGRGSGNKNITKSINNYDIYLTYDKSTNLKLINDYNLQSEIIPFGYEIDEITRRECQNLKEIVRVCFIGNPDKYRSKFIMEISKELPVSVYGKDWKKFISNPSIEINDSVIGLEFYKTLYRYRVQLNLMRIHNLDSHNMRSFEITGIGGIGLMPDTPDHRYFFKDQSEVFLFKSTSECVKIAKKLLSLDEFDATKIRKGAIQRSQTSKYTYKDRTSLFIDILNKYI